MISQKLTENYLTLRLIEGSYSLLTERGFFNYEVFMLVSNHGSPTHNQGESWLAMSKKPMFPKRIAVTVDKNSEGPINENLLAWKNERVADEGYVAVYTLLDVVQTKSSTKVKKQGETQWFDLDLTERG